ncbi:MAG TPA: ribokinase [Candidatus Binatia bacterium]
MESEPIIISLGSINADFQVRAERWAEAGHDFLVTDFMRFGGGKAANVAYAARRLSAPVMLIGHVGDDDLAEQALNPLRQLPLDLPLVSRVRGMATGFVTIVVTPDGKKTMIAAHNANDVWTEKETANAASAVAKAAAGSILVVDCAISIDPVERAARAAAQRKFPIILDPSPAERVPDRLFPLVEFVTPNPVEAQQLTGIAVQSIEDALRAGRALISRGTKVALMKMPEGGCVTVTADSAIAIRPTPVKVIDTTGAGDVFAGALATALLERQSLLNAVRIAVAAAHVSVTRYGAQASYPDRTEIEEMVARLPSDEHIT